MNWELDHLFILTPANRILGDRLVEFGLTEGTSNRHLGRGNRE
ncbi:hypothetical protein [Spirulina subsalsa]|nr:hypothetical protein [Spirulina subsalsa]